MDKKPRRKLADNFVLERSHRLKEIRQKKGLTQEEFAEFLGIGKDTYAKVENGTNSLSNDMLQRYKNKMNISADYLLFGDTKSLEQIWGAVITCSNKDKLHLLLRLLGYFADSDSGLQSDQQKNRLYEYVEKFMEEL